MVRQQTYIHLTAWLGSEVEREYDETHKDWRTSRTLRGLGKRGKTYQAWVEATLVELFEKYLCFSDSRMVLVGGDSSTLYAYNGRYYDMVDVKGGQFILELIKRVMRSLDIGTAYIQGCSDKIAKSVYSTLTSSDEYLYRPDRRYIAFENCIFDLRDGKPKKFGLDKVPYLSLDVDYHDTKEAYRLGAQGNKPSDNPCKLWDDKIREIIPNEDAREAFRQFCGGLLIDREEVKIEYICYLVGNGSNGKSVVANTIAGVFGDKSFSRFSLRQLFKDSDARVNIAALEGKICNLIGDLEAKDVSGGDFKRAVSGEWFQGRKNYRDPIMVKFPPLLCCANEMPQTSDDSWGHHRRQLPIYTTERQWTEEDKDPMLTQKLTVPLARAYIFNWIYEGYRRIVKNGGNIRLGDDVKDAQAKLMSRSSSGRCWWDDRGYVKAKPVMMRTDPRWMSLDSLYADYVGYAVSNGYEKQMKKNEISAMLRNMGFKDGENIKRSSSGLMVCVGRLNIDTSFDGGVLSE